MSSLHDLTAVLRPPSNPAQAPDEDDWQMIEADLGFELPGEYKEYISIYGTGSIDNFFWVFTPFSGNRHLNLINQIKVRLEAQGQLSEDFGIHAPYALHTSANGLLPWGMTDNGDVLYWLLDGPSSDWPIVVCDGRGSMWREYKLSFSRFLVAVVTRRISIDIFPDDFPSETPEFVQ